MNRDSNPTIQACSIALPENAAAKVWASCFRQATKDGLIIFTTFAFLGLGFSAIARQLLQNDISPAGSLSIALTIGFLAFSAVFFLNFADWSLIRKDLKSGTCIEATIHCERALRVQIEGSSLEGVALDCGDETLLLIGDWWLNKNRLEIWDDPDSRKHFPAKRFHIRFLPGSGKVLFVKVLGGSLHIQKKNKSEPILQIKFPKYSEALHVKQQLATLVVSATR